jgi:hypothetical protein
MLPEGRAYRCNEMLAYELRCFRKVYINQRFIDRYGLYFLLFVNFDFTYLKA